MGRAAIRIGTIEVVALCEGWAPLPLRAELPGHEVDWASERDACPWSFAARDEHAWAWHVHAFLLRVPGGPVLVDTGTGHLGVPPYAVPGRIDDELRAAGVDATEVRHVIHTHLHADHAGGACRPDGEPRFPNAVHHLHPADRDCFAAKGPDDAEGWPAMRRLVELDMLDLDPADREIVQGVRVIHSPGHTPGHRSVVVDDRRSTLLLTGDLLHLPVQAAHPDWASSHDQDPALGIASRLRILDQARDQGWRVAVSHFGRPFGHVAARAGAQWWASG